MICLVSYNQSKLKILKEKRGRSKFDQKRGEGWND